MANRNAKENRAIKESVVLSNIDAGKDATPKKAAKPTPAPKVDRDAKLNQRKKRDLTNKLKRKQIGEARAAASRGPGKPTRAIDQTRTEDNSDLTLRLPGGKIVDETTAKDLADRIRRGGSKDVLAELARGVTGGGKAGTKSQTNKQKKAQERINAQGQEVANQLAETRLQDKFEGNVLTPFEKRRHEIRIAQAIRTQGHLNDPDTQKSVAALGTRAAGYIAGQELERMANEK